MASSSSNQIIPKIDVILHDPPEKDPAPLYGIDAPVPFGAAEAHSKLNPESSGLEEPSADKESPLRNSESTQGTSKSSPVTSSDKLSELPSNPPLSSGRVGSDFKQITTQSYTFPSSGGSENNSLRRLPSNDKAKGSSDPVARIPIRRNSLDSDHRSIGAATLRGVRSAFSRLGPQDPPSPDPTSPVVDPPSNTTGNRRRSGSRTRATSPLRFFSPLIPHRATREEPFIPENPFRVEIDFWKLRFLIPCVPHKRSPPDIEEAKSNIVLTAQLPLTPNCDQVIFPETSRAAFRRFLANSGAFIIDATRVVYLYILLGLPAMYFGRVSRIFTEAEVSRPDIERMINAVQDSPTMEYSFYFEGNRGLQGGDGSNHYNNEAGTSRQPPSAIGSYNQTPVGGGANTLPFSDDFAPPLVTPALARFKRSWEMFIDTLSREWKTMNLVSALFLSAQISIFQIPEAAYDPVTRSVALLALMCALMSLSFGCIYIVRFSGMRSMLRASRWAEEAQKHRTSMFWNLWILLCLPALWLAWSMILFIISLLSFVWRTGSVDDPPADQIQQLSSEAALAFRIIVTLVVALGFFYFILIVRTLKHYGRTHHINRQAPPRPSNATGSAALKLDPVISRGRRTDRLSSIRHDDFLNSEPPVDKQTSALGLDLGRQTSHRSAIGVV